MKITFEISYHKPDISAVLFNARRTYTSSNFGNDINIRIGLKEADSTYRTLFGDFENFANTCNAYGAFLADCIKYNFKIKSINGSACSLNPYREGYTTREETITIELEEA